MSTAEFVAFLGVAVIVIVTPGQDTALTIRNTLLGGKAGGIATAAGVAAGQAAWTALTTLGLSSLLIASEPAFMAVRILGIVYLAYLGAQALVGAIRPRPEASASLAPARTRLGGAAAFRQGLISNLGNPKMVAFFPSLLPQFVPSSHAAFWLLPLLGFLFCAMTFAWLTGYATVVGRTGELFRRPHVRRVIEGSMGVALLGVSLRLAAERR
jgi:threonine/homoserine/homoserine lactone efflux protein